MKTLQLNRVKIFMAGLFIVLLFLALNRLNFVMGSKFATGKVSNIKSWSGRTGYHNYSNNDNYHSYSSSSGYTSYTAPIIKFAAQGYDITFQAETNMELEPGDVVSVIYKENDLTNAKVFSFTGFILSPLIYCLIPVLILLAAAFSFLDAKDLIIVNIEKFYKINVSKGRIPGNGLIKK